jgi:hypothetical protein
VLGSANENLCKGPGALKKPAAIATTKSAIPNTFQVATSQPRLDPSAGIYWGHEQRGKADHHIAKASWQRKDSWQQPLTIKDEKDGTETSITLNANQ